MDLVGSVRCTVERRGEGKLVARTECESPGQVGQKEYFVGAVHSEFIDFISGFVSMPGPRSRKV